MGFHNKLLDKLCGCGTLLGAFFQAGHSGTSLPGQPTEAWLRRAAAQGDREAQEKCRALGLRWNDEEEENR